MHKILYLLLTIFLASLSSYSQEGKINFRDPQTWLLGHFEPELLLQDPHGEWYHAEFDKYPLDHEPFIKLSEKDLSEIDILVVLGTWCPDSRREVPRFMKISQSLSFDQGKIKMIGTDSYKIAPVDAYDELGIEKVPTFIFYHNKKELGRIIEYPKTSLEKDMLEIFADKVKE